MLERFSGLESSGNGDKSKLTLAGAALAAILATTAAVKNVYAEEGGAVGTEAKETVQEEHGKAGAQQTEMVFKAGAITPEVAKGLSLSGSGTYKQLGLHEHQWIGAAGVLLEPAHGLELGLGAGYKNQDGHSAFAPYIQLGKENSLGPLKMSSEVFFQPYVGEHFHFYGEALSDVYLNKGENIALGLHAETASNPEGHLQYVVGGPQLTFQVPPVKATLFLNGGGYQPEGEEGAAGQAHVASPWVSGYNAKFVLGVNFDMRHKEHEADANSPEH
ncbi:MAG: hypothetical protein WC843_05435 [Candidatus Gracilibacteria bacterium]